MWVDGIDLKVRLEQTGSACIRYADPRVLTDRFSARFLCTAGGQVA